MSDSPDLSQLQNIDVRISVEWGRARITLEEARALGPDAILKVNSEASDPVDVRVNGKLICRGKIVVVGDSYGVQITQFLEGDRGT
jgi:flagellar motor switch protein FliN/FliY